MSLNLDIPDTPRLRDTLAALCLLLLCVASGGAGYWIGGGNAPVREVITHASAVQQHDGSLVLERDPASAKPPPAPHAIPKGAKRERAISVTVQPKREDCPPVRTDLSLIQQDGGRRVIASSPDGTVTSGMDMPIEAALLPPAPRKWATGVNYDPFGRRYGGWLERDVGRLRFGVDVNQSDRFGIEARVRLGLNF